MFITIYKYDVLKLSMFNTLLQLNYIKILQETNICANKTAH